MKKLIVALVCIFLPLLAVTAHAGNVTVTWVQNTTTCEDGSPMAANCPLTGFQVSEGASADTLAVKENQGPGARSVTYQNIAAGTTKCYSLKAFTGTSTAPVLSGESTRACVTVPSVPPKAPTGLSVTVQVTVSTP